ncbi:MAG: helix-turn-helix domain-containing protein, partial [Actinomycetota bacterium]|nr:helix-turn-helix domain-containing protein [Actinomycetota bacterium]
MADPLRPVEIESTPEIPHRRDARLLPRQALLLPLAPSASALVDGVKQRFDVDHRRPGDGRHPPTVRRSASTPSILTRCSPMGWAVRRVRAGVAQRARIVLLAAQGLPNAEIARRVGVSGPTVLAWRNRYAAGGVAALRDAPRSGRPPVHDEVAVVVATLEPPPGRLEVTHWSARLLADQLGISFATCKWDLGLDLGGKSPGEDDFELVQRGGPAVSARAAGEDALLPG